MKTDFYQHLLNQGLALNTARLIDNIVENYHVQKAPIIDNNYSTVMDYIKYCQSIGNATRTISQKLKALDYYFDYIHHPKNPAKEIKLKGIVQKIPTRLLSEEELEGNVVEVLIQMLRSFVIV